MKKQSALFWCLPLSFLTACAVLQAEVDDSQIGDVTHRIVNSGAKPFIEAQANGINVPVAINERGEQEVRFTQRRSDTNDVVFRIVLGNDPPEELKFRCLGYPERGPTDAPRMLSALRIGDREVKKFLVLH